MWIFGGVQDCWKVTLAGNIGIFSVCTFDWIVMTIAFKVEMLLRREMWHLPGSSRCLPQRICAPNCFTQKKHFFTTTFLGCKRKNDAQNAPFRNINKNGCSSKNPGGSVAITCGEKPIKTCQVGGEKFEGHGWTLRSAKKSRQNWTSCWTQALLGDGMGFCFRNKNNSDL